MIRSLVSYPAVPLTNEARRPPAMNEPTPEMTSAPSRPAAPRPYRRSHFGGPRHQSRNRPGLAPALATWLIWTVLWPG